MGYAIKELTSPAILFSNPGLDKHQLAEKFDEVFHGLTNNRYYGGGLRRVAYELGLNLTRAFLDFQRENVDENGLIIEPPRSYLNPFGYDISKNEPLTVQIHEKNIIKPARQVKFSSYNYRIMKNSLISRYDCDLFFEGENDSFDDFILVKNRQLKREGTEEDGFFYYYKATILPVERVYRVVEYPSEEDLIKAFPQYEPENEYDFSQERSTFNTAFSDYFRWIQQDGKYYLDPQTLDLIPASIISTRYQKEISFGYTDLIMTAEVIRKKAWKYLGWPRSYESVDISDFLTRFPDSMRIYEQAVWDSHTSLAAKRAKMTYTEFLKARLLGWKIPY